MLSGRGRSKDHCPECAARRRAILAKAGELTEWFTKLQDADPDAYSVLSWPVVGWELGGSVGLRQIVAGLSMSTIVM